MRRSTRKAAGLLIISFVMIAALASQVWADDVESARHFLEQLYAKYTVLEKEPNPLGNDGAKLFAPELLALIREDQRRSMGEVGLLDHDPICSCQDFENLKVTEIQASPAGQNRAKAKVSFVNGGNAVEVGFLLVRKSGQWRILDIQEPDVPSLKRYLKEGLGGTTSPSKQ
jgi:hypothetical protein